jgi:regulator of protease activity HflC (stomatin/prohibitin superfamily)
MKKILINKQLLVAGIVVMVPLLLVLLLVKTYTIASGTVGVLATFGEFSDKVEKPGLHFRIRLVQDVFVVDIKLKTVEYSGDQDLPDREGLVKKPIIQVLDSKNLTIGIELSVQYTPDIESANQILEWYGWNYFDKLINPLIRNVVRDVIGGYQAEEIAIKRPEIGTEIERRLTRKFEGLPFTLKNVALRDIKLPPIVVKKIEEVQLAKQEEERLAMVERQARKEQEIKTIQANTRLIEVTTQAKADAEKKRIEADAKAYQITKEAEAAAMANKLIAASVTPQLIKYRAIERWSGQYPRVLLGNEGGQGVLLTLPDLGEAR